jgi:hypothetical protein
MIMWNRLRYTVWAPAYDAIARAAEFNTARRVSIDRLRLASGDRVLIVGAGTGLDLDFLPSSGTTCEPASLSGLNPHRQETPRIITVANP